jgi:hypothetical protein
MSDPVFKISKSELAEICQQHGSLLQPYLSDCTDPDGKMLDGPKLLWAMSGRESSFGQDMKPRHEPAYDVGGVYWKLSQEVKDGCALYGHDFACSYGPLQVLAVNTKGWTPEEMGKDPFAALEAACMFLKNYVLGRKRAHTLAEICQCWNGGHVGATTTAGYVDEVTKYYRAGIPSF